MASKESVLLPLGATITEDTSKKKKKIITNLATHSGTPLSLKKLGFTKIRFHMSSI
jgi:hypothetical protein